MGSRSRKEHQADHGHRASFTEEAGRANRPAPPPRRPGSLDASSRRGRSTGRRGRRRASTPRAWRRWRPPACSPPPGPPPRTRSHETSGAATGSCHMRGRAARARLDPAKEVSETRLAAEGPRVARGGAVGCLLLSCRNGQPGAAAKRRISQRSIGAQGARHGVDAHRRRDASPYQRGKAKGARVEGVRVRSSHRHSWRRRRASESQLERSALRQLQTEGLATRRARRRRDAPRRSRRARRRRRRNARAARRG